jgi:molybdopterin converting factor small subunit
MQVFVDDKPIDEEGIEGSTLGDALRHVQSNLPAPHKIVAGVLCDGELIPAQDMIASLEKPLAEIDRVDVITSTKEDLVIDVMTHASTTLDESETTSQRVAQLLTEGKSAAARQALGDCIRTWQQIHDAVAQSLSILRLDPETIMIRDELLIDAIGKPRDVLLQIKDALVAGDEVVLADILQYEFADVVQTWHAIIARLRREAEDLREKP